MSFIVTTDEREDIILTLQEEIKNLKQCVKTYKEFSDYSEEMRLKAEEFIDKEGMYEKYQVWLVTTKKEQSKEE